MNKTRLSLISLLPEIPRRTSNLAWYSRSSVIAYGFLIAVQGCARGSNYSTVELAGEVSIDGSPVEQGSVNFVPVGGDAGTGVSATIMDGRYRGTVPAGRLQVFIVATKETGRTITMLGQPHPEIINLVPFAYRSGIEIEVFSADSSRDFALRSR